MPAARWLLAAVFAVAAATPHPVAMLAADGLATAPWKLEAIELVGGRRLEGLLDDDPANGDGSVSFTEVVRRPGRGMYLVHRANLGADRIRSVERLPPAEHAALADRLAAFREQGAATRRAEAAVRFTRSEPDGRLEYRGEWFDLASSASDAITREAVARLERLFPSFEALVPASRGDDRSGPAKLAVRLCATDAEYREVQRKVGVSVRNPAFYVGGDTKVELDARHGRGRLLVAGSDYPILAAEHAIAEESLAASELAAREQEASLEAVLRDLAARLERQGIPAAKRGDIIRLARARHERERADAAEKLAAARRANHLALESARRVFHGRLAHEAWHAHADRLAGGDSGAKLPPWLDEGLAQVFETAPLEDGELRLDTPDATRLEALWQLLATWQPGRLRELLSLGGEAFLVGHAGDERVSREAYLTAWGLALHVALLEPVLDRAAVGKLAAADGGKDPIGTFETLVGMPVERFEAAWRARMLGLTPGERRESRAGSRP